MQPLVQNIVCTHGDSRWQKHTHAHSVPRPYLNRPRLSLFGIHSLFLCQTYKIAHTILSLIPKFRKTNHFHLPPTILFLNNFQRLCSPLFFCNLKKCLFLFKLIKSAIMTTVATFNFFWNLKVILTSDSSFLSALTREAINIIFSRCKVWLQKKYQAKRIVVKCCMSLREINVLTVF